MDLLGHSRFVPQSSSKVCAKCYEDAAPYNNTRWLTWLECGHHPDHEEEDRVTLIVGDDDKVVCVREPLDSQLKPPCEKMHWRGGCHDGDRAHCIEELEYWKWKLAHTLLEYVIILSLQ